MGYTAKVLRTATLNVPGILAVGSSGARWYNRTPAPITIQTVTASVGLASLGSTIIVDLNMDETSLYTNQTLRPAIAIGTNTATTTPSTRTMPVGSYLTVDIDQVGSTSAGADLVVQVTY